MGRLYTHLTLRPRLDSILVDIKSSQTTITLVLNFFGMGIFVRMLYCTYLSRLHFVSILFPVLLVFKLVHVKEIQKYYYLRCQSVVRCCNECQKIVRLRDTILCMHACIMYTSIQINTHRNVCIYLHNRSLRTIK